MAIIAHYPTLSADWLRHELDPRLHREQGNILAGTGDLPTGAVMAKRIIGDATVSPLDGNTGAGTLTLDVTTPVLAGATVGTYKVRCIAEAANSGTFRVWHPNGHVLGDVAVGATWADGVKFVIADVGEDFDIGDGFDVDVASGSGVWSFYDPTAVDGLQHPAGILLDSRDASGDADVPAVFVTGEAEIVVLPLTWGPAVDNGTKRTAGVERLKVLGFKIRQLT